jgi:hypothetical protein
MRHDINIIVARRDAFKRRITVDAPAASNIANTSSPMSKSAWSSSTKPPRQNATAATPSPRMDTRPLTVLLQGDTTSTMASTTFDVEQLHRQYNRAHGSCKTVAGSVVSSSPGKTGGLTYDHVL